MNCQILKLKSGEEIICEIIDQTKTKCTINNPFIFKPMTIMNMNTGQPIDMITVKDWLISSDNKTMVLPVNHIASFIVPSKDSIFLYESEKKRIAALLREVKKSKKSRKNKKNLPPVDAETEEDLRAQAEAYGGSEFFDMMDQMLNSMLPETNEEDSLESPNSPSSKRNRKNLKQEPIVHMSIEFPPEVILELMEAGIINVNDIKRIARDIKKKMKYTGDEKHRPDFGNKFSDWNPDLSSEDYK